VSATQPLGNKPEEVILRMCFGVTGDSIPVVQKAYPVVVVIFLGKTQAIFLRSNPDIFIIPCLTGNAQKRHLIFNVINIID